MGNSWALEGANGGGSDRLKSESGGYIFLKVCAEGEGARQGAWSQCPVSPLLSLLIFSSFFSLNLSQVFFLSLYLLYFLYSSLSLSIISFLFPSFILPSSFFFPSLDFLSLSFLC